MNYILQKVNCKALIVFVLATVLSIASASIAFAYTMRKIPNFWFDKKFVFVAENVSPREPSYSSVTISYDDLASLVYYCNEHRLSTSLVYNSAIDRYVGYVSDSALDIRKFDVSSLYGLWVMWTEKYTWLRILVLTFMLTSPSPPIPTTQTGSSI